MVKLDEEIAKTIFGMKRVIARDEDCKNPAVQASRPELTRPSLQPQIQRSHTFNPPIAVTSLSARQITYKMDSMVGQGARRFTRL